MKHKFIFIITGIIGLFYGLLLVFVPGGFYARFGAELTDFGKSAAQYQGAAYLGFAILFFLAANVGESKARKAIVMGGFTHFLVGLIVAVRLQIVRTSGNDLTWTTVAVLALLTLGFGYLLIKKGD